MKTNRSDYVIFTKEFTKQEAIPEEGIRRAIELMQSGRLHRYNTAPGEVGEVALLEKEYATYVNAKYCVALSSCGSALYVALKSVGVKTGDKVLCNAFTLAPVPGAIENAGAKVILVGITPNYTVDMEDLKKRTSESRARFFLLSHMRGHITDMDLIRDFCRQHEICLVEDCAHTVGCRWEDKFIGTFGKVGCFSTQTYKHMNSGEGGLLVTDDENVIAQAILYSGSYMFYEKHLSRPPSQVFEKYKKIIPNFSLRMTNLQAALIRPQLKDLENQCDRWNRRYAALESGLNEIDHIRVPPRPAKEHYVGSSIQFTLHGVKRKQVESFLHECTRRGVEIKWFGWSEPVGFTSSFEHWKYIQQVPELACTKKILDFMCDIRIPLTFSLEDCRTVATVIGQVADELFP
jgi:dTDP-4-amino-4,6-dideoxygalactose transaminase